MFMMLEQNRKYLHPTLLHEVFPPLSTPLLPSPSLLWPPFIFSIRSPMRCKVSMIPLHYTVPTPALYGTYSCIIRYQRLRIWTLQKLFFEILAIFEFLPFAMYAFPFIDLPEETLLLTAPSMAVLPSSELSPNLLVSYGRRKT